MHEEHIGNALVYGVTVALQFKAFSFGGPAKRIYFRARNCRVKRTSTNRTYRLHKERINLKLGEKRGRKEVPEEWNVGEKWMVIRA